MGWLDRIRGALPEDSEPEEPEEEGPAAVERAAPGVAALFAGLKEDGSHTVLDLGSAVHTHLRLFSPFSRRIRFAGLLPRPPVGGGWAPALRALSPHPRHLYDVVLAWNALDLLGRDERALMIERLDQLSAEGARVYFVVDASGRSATPQLRFELQSLDRVSQRTVGPPVPGGSRLLPAQVESLLAPFEVVRAFTLRQELREYVAVKGGEAAYSRRAPLRPPRPERTS